MSKSKFTCTWCEEDHMSGCVNLACPIGFHNVKSMRPEALGEDRPDPLETTKNESFELGRVGLLEDLPKRFTAKAGEAFAVGKDDRAHFWRDLAREVAKEAEAARSTWTQKYHPERIKR